MVCNYCEEEMLFSNSVFDVRLKGRICKDCAEELANGKWKEEKQSSQ